MATKKTDDLKKALFYKSSNAGEVLKETEIKNNAEIKKALDAIGFSDGGEQSEQTE